MQNNLDVGIISINPTFSLSLVHPSFSTNSGMCMHTLLTQKKYSSVQLYVYAWWGWLYYPGPDSLKQHAQAQQAHASVRGEFDPRFDINKI